jgi:hypothetical protein
MRRGVLLWSLATSAAFLATAGAFLLLANLGTGPGSGSDPIPRAPEAAGPALALRFAEDRLGELERRPDQALTLFVENRGDRELPEVDVTLAVASEANLSADQRRYEENLEGLVPGERKAVEMQVDLSPPAAETPEAQDQREILEARATTPDGVSAVETAVLAP